MSYEPKFIDCRDCGKNFEFTVGEQEFYAEKGLSSEPTRCVDCRRAKKAAASSRGGRGGFGGDRGYGRDGGDREGGYNRDRGYGGDRRDRPYGGDRGYERPPAKTSRPPATNARALAPSPSGPPVSVPCFAAIASGASASRSSRSPSVIFPKTLYTQAKFFVV
eukprot:TRINITY_DN270_c0_g1_i1.p1 TRINITY_DN270_c0_g1~~TRINITY_DN270_c0_g1_i1.p1  ORF type:complete len:188 (+),score=48.06 TRINITY_DN270_c0_g1_i1:78-566(+)